MDSENVKAILGAMEKMVDHSRQLQSEREEKLWKNIKVGASLTDALGALPKVEMDNIRKNLELKNLSSLKKAELAGELARLIPGEFKRVLTYLDWDRYQLVRSIAHSSGVLEMLELPTQYISRLMRYGIVFPVLDGKRKALYMPSELVEAFLEIDGPELAERAKRNTQWMQLTSGMLYYYGVLDVKLTVAKLKTLTGSEVDIVEFAKVIVANSDFYQEVDFAGKRFKNHGVLDEEKVIAGQQMKTAVSYYPFTKEQLLKAGEPGYIDRTSATQRFVNLLLKSYKLKEEDANGIIRQLIFDINNDAKPGELMQYLQSRLEFPNYDFVQLLTAELMNFYQNTRQWELKGYSPHELSQQSKNLAPLAAKPIADAKKAENVIDLKTRKKIGRNEPCPCGSSKKYKKCCGK